VDSIQHRYTAALEALVERVRTDRAIVAAILCGSLSHDTVWERSDIDLVFVTADDRRPGRDAISLYADGVNVHALLMSRASFRKTVEGSLHNSFVHAFLMKGRLLYTHDPTIAELCARLHEMGERDTQVQLLRAAAGALHCVDKAHKWFRTRGDLEYTALWILYAATSLARIEVVGARQLADREVILQARRLNPAFFDVVYHDLLNNRKTKAGVEAALQAVDQYIGERATALFGPVVDHLREVGEARACDELEDHFRRHFDVSGVTTACEYLADRGLIGKASIPARLTKSSTVDVQELAFVYLGEPPRAV